MSAGDTTVRLADRLATAYGTTVAEMRTALASLAPINVDADAVSFERHGDDVLLVWTGEVVATLALGSVLPRVAAACDTLDPYGDRVDILVSPLIHDPHAPRIASTGHQ